MNKILIISGPTATGKTALAIRLAKKYKGELISADSRQIYRGMDIGTGKDHPKDVAIHLIDIIDPSISFSVAQFRQLALAKIKEIHLKNKLPIIVGGTGQYIDSIINNHPSFSVKPNHILRFFLNKISTRNLQFIYKFLDKKNYLNLNNSDKFNPHRLIRKIEIKMSLKSTLSKGDLEGLNFLHLSLTAPNSFLYSRIDARVQKRLDQGLLTEIKNLLKKYSWSDPGLNTLAYKEFKDYFNSPVETFCRTSLLKETQKIWAFHEHAYMRRQKTWFKKFIKGKFYDITKANYQKNIIKQVDMFLKSPLSKGDLEGFEP